MPAPVDLRGRRFGALTARVRVQGGGWLCDCDCGRETVVPVQRLSSVKDTDPRAIRACEICRSRRCVVCGALYLKAGSAATCGAAECRAAHRRMVNAESQARAELLNPGIKAKRARAYWKSVMADPIKLALRRERDREYAAMRRRAKPMEDRRADARLYYALHREQVQHYQARWKAEMSDEKRAAWREKNRQAGRAKRARQALARFMALGEKLISLKENADE